VRSKLNDNFLRKMPDLMKLSRKFNESVVDLESMYKLYLITTQLDTLIDLLKDDELYVKSAITDPLKDLSARFANYHKLVEEVIDLPRVLSDREFRVSLAAHVDLEKLSGERKELEEELEEVKYRVRKELSLEEIQLKKDKVNGYFFQVANKYEVHLRNRREYDMISNNQKDAVRFSCDDLYR
jgi:DNA mismatch repair protein MSH2